MATNWDPTKGTTLVHIDGEEIGEVGRALPDGTPVDNGLCVLRDITVKLFDLTPEVEAALRERQGSQAPGFWLALELDGGRKFYSPVVEVGSVSKQLAELAAKSGGWGV